MTGHEEAKNPKKRKLWYRKKAVALLAKWASAGARIDFIDQSCGLRHPGTVRQLDSGNFLFVSASGANTPIFPLLWQSVTAEKGIETEELANIHIEEYGRSYSLVLGHSYQNDGLKDAEALLASWSELELQELYVSCGEFPVWSFLGSLKRIGDRYYMIRERNSGMSLTFCLDNKICRIEKLGDNAALYITDPHQRSSILVSETPLSAADLVRRFSSASESVN